MKKSNTTPMKKSNTTPMKISNTEAMKKSNTTAMKKSNTTPMKKIMNGVKINKAEPIRPTFEKKINEETTATLEQYYKAIKEGAEIDEDLKTKLADMMDKLAECEDFYKLHLINIFAIISKVDFSEYSNYYELITKIIKNTLYYHPRTRRVIDLLNYIRLDMKCLSFHEWIGLLQYFTKSPVCINIYKSYREYIELPLIDMEYQIDKKNKEINELREKIDELTCSHEFMQKPIDFEDDIFKAIENNKQTSVEYLIYKEKVDKNIQNSEGSSLLHVACSIGNLSMVNYLINNIKVDINSKDKNQKTPLHIATEKDHISIVYVLVKNGADLDARDKFGRTPLHSACFAGIEDIALYLLKETKSDKNARDNYGDTPLHLASYTGHLNIAKYLIENHAFINVLNKSGKNPSQVACEWQNQSQKQYFKSLFQCYRKTR